MVDPTMIVSFNSIAAEQAKSMQATSKVVTQFINYDATHSELIARYHTRGMVLQIDSDI